MSGLEGNLSVVIPSRGRPRMLLETVESILRGDRVPEEIVVVDQSDSAHETLGSLEAPDGCRIVYVHSQERGLSRARNRGVHAARHDLLVFIDDDMLVDEAWLGTLAAALRRLGPRWIVTGQVRELQGDGAFAPSASPDSTRREYRGRQLLDPLYAGNMGFHRSVVTEIGPFDERLGAGSGFPAAEDNDFGYRFLRAGGAIAYVPSAVANHRAWRGQSDYLPLRRAYGRGQGAFYAKHLLSGDLYSARRYLWILAYYGKRFPRRVREQPWRARGDLAYVGGLIAGTAAWMRGVGRDDSATPAAASRASSSRRRAR
jgi:GT2 family glycosyltransferase